MNLILDAWIPVRCRDGTHRRIAPWRLTDNHGTNPLVALASPRPDFDGALAQFLIGLLQTACAPEDNRDWRAWLGSPPPPETLKAAFEPLVPAFHLDGDGPRFMQEQGLPMKDSSGIDGLLIEAPGDQTLKQNKDLFVKRAGVEGMCSVCCATALFTLQTNSPSGGKGHRTSLRGGGPLTTLVVGDDLWSTLWLNVLPNDEFEALGNPERSGMEDRFPWMGATRTSENGEETTAEHANAAQVFWSAPRRILLDTATAASGSCDICGSEVPIVRRYWTRPYGFNYKGGWIHSLTPHVLDKEGTRSPRHVQPGGVGYRHWLGLVIADSERGHEPARVIQSLRTRSRKGGGLRLWAFGYDMDNMKARGWYENLMPLPVLDAAFQERFDSRVEGLVRVADTMCRTATTAVKRALFGTAKIGNKGKVDWHLPRTLKADADFFDAMQAQFWSATEPAFFATLHDIRRAIELGLPPDPACEAWLATLRATGDMLFERFSQTGHFEAIDARSVAMAWNELRRFNSPRNRKLRDLLLLPTTDAPAATTPPTQEVTPQ